MLLSGSGCRVGTIWTNLQKEMSAPSERVARRVIKLVREDLRGVSPFLRGERRDADVRRQWDRWWKAFGGSWVWRELNIPFPKKMALGRNGKHPFVVSQKMVIQKQNSQQSIRDTSARCLGISQQCSHTSLGFIILIHFSIVICSISFIESLSQSHNVAISHSRLLCSVGSTGPLSFHR